MTKDTLSILAVSILSIVCGILLYKYTLHEDEFVVGKPKIQTIQTSSVQSMPFADIVLNDLDGNPQHLTHWKKPLQVLNFWAPWCPPCRREIPALVDLQNSYADSVQFIGLSFDSTENVIEFQNKYTLNYPLLMVQQEAKQINQTFGNNSAGLPFTVIMDQERNIAFQHVGEISRQQLETEIKRLL